MNSERRRANPAEIKKALQSGQRVSADDFFTAISQEEENLSLHLPPAIEEEVERILARAQSRSSVKKDKL